MKFYCIPFFLILNFSFSQTQIDSIRLLSFKINFPPASASVDDIDFTKEKPECAFELKGKSPLKYSFRLQNDSLVSLYQFKNEEFQFQENLDYQPFLWHFHNDQLYSNFKIVDFDNDGDEDLLCWVYSNVNGNEWTIIFINDQIKHKLVRLYNTVEKTDIWSRPEFDKKTNTINTELYGSAFGISEESSYKLNEDLTLTPLKKHFQDRTGKHIINYEYVGKNKKWKLKSKAITKQ
ncbi:hypothetical protein SAMN05444397_105251 [Flavobacterium aquidurense]|uniref:VCBS repeat-containing protein n=1 Tax=Flavobacterium frigidimaris TaxID=262320 RepID=A0ABX4BQG7_FLAFR|nr:hypothetical protein [Flavobacterium frigidimaris]OXA79313.1 hypothetical protein B0A65_10145 [Flavobacterium frigidimaris]SDZ33644.1 hypothetical protein SAMN05444397_105251 [Flavobacterium aquidurense]